MNGGELIKCIAFFEKPLISRTRFLLAEFVTYFDFAIVHIESD